MSTKDKTRQKLVDSMRKTKASAQEQTGTETAAAAVKATTAPETKTPAPETKTPVRQPAATSKAPQPKQTDPYQSVRRVWPD